METRTYTVTYGVSRARDTEGYNIISVRDSSGKLVARAMGGGYDMWGTVVAEAVTKYAPDKVKALAQRAAGSVFHGEGPTRKHEARHKNGSRPDVFYGLNWDTHANTAWIDGGCGIRSVQSIIEGMGIAIDYSYKNKRSTDVVAFTLGPKKDES